MFATFLDETMTYSAALFVDPPRTARSTTSRATVASAPDPGIPTRADLVRAQRRKLERLLDQTGVGAGTRLLEIGTGWGELCIRAAQRGATVRSVTLSSEQKALAEQRIAVAGLERPGHASTCSTTARSTASTTRSSASR